jgi:hypothetical protein
MRSAVGWIGFDVGGLRNAGADGHLAKFAATVLSIAESIDEEKTPEGLARGRFGRKVFLSAIRRALRRTPYAGLPRSVIDRLFVDAHNERLLDLARGDLMAVMDPEEVRDSEIQHRTSTWHFVVAERRNAGVTGSGTAAQPYRGTYRTRPRAGGVPVEVAWALWWTGRNWHVDLEVGGETWAEDLSPTAVSTSLVVRIPKTAATAIERQIARQITRSQHPQQPTLDV